MFSLAKVFTNTWKGSYSVLILLVLFLVRPWQRIVDVNLTISKLTFFFTDEQTKEGLQDVPKSQYLAIAPLRAPLHVNHTYVEQYLVLIRLCY